MLSAFKYRLYPKPEQETRLNRSLLSLCNLYNDLKAEEMRRYNEEHKSTSQITFRALALDARKHNEKLQHIHSQVVQNVGDRIHRSFRNFFEGRARFPNWKKPQKYNSLTFPQFGFRLDLKKGLFLFGLGCVRIFVHRPLLGKVKRLTIKREAGGEWHAIFVTERQESVRSPLAEIPIDRIRGADMGLSKFMTFDDSTSAEYPKFMTVGGQDRSAPASLLKEAQGLQASSRTRPKACRAPPAHQAPARRLPEKAGPPNLH